MHHLKEEVDNLLPPLLPRIGIDHRRPGEETLLRHSIEHAAGFLQAATFCIHTNEFGLYEGIWVTHQRDRCVKPPALIDGVRVDAGLEQGIVGSGPDGETPFQGRDGFLELPMAAEAVHLAVSGVGVWWWGWLRWF